MCAFDDDTHSITSTHVPAFLYDTFPAISHRFRGSFQNTFVSDSHIETLLARENTNLLFSVSFGVFCHVS